MDKESGAATSRSRVHCSKSTPKRFLSDGDAELDSTAHKRSFSRRQSDIPKRPINFAIKELTTIQKEYIKGLRDQLSFLRDQLKFSQECLKFSQEREKLTIQRFESRKTELETQVKRFKIQCLIDSGKLNARTLIETFETDVLKKQWTDQDRMKFWRNLSSKQPLIVELSKQRSWGRTEVAEIVGNLYDKLSREIHLHTINPDRQLLLNKDQLSDDELTVLSNIGLLMPLKIIVIPVSKKEIQDGEDDETWYA